MRTVDSGPALGRICPTSTLHRLEDGPVSRLWSRLTNSRTRRRCCGSSRTKLSRGRSG